MSREFKLPDLGEGIHEGEVIAVLVSVGQDVLEGDPILEIETDKAAVEIPSPYSGSIENIHVRPGDVVNVGDVHVRKGEFDQAVTYFEQALEQAPEDEVLPFNVAEIYFDQGNVAGAIEYYKRAASIRTDWVEPELKLGYAYINMADMENAAVHFKKVIEMAPDTPQAAVAQAALDSIQPQ